MKSFSTNRLVLAIALVGAAVLIVVCVPLMTQTLRGPGADCGTIFASSDSWTYESTKRDPSSYFDGATSQAELEAGASAGVADIFADLDRGASAYDFCEQAHSDRRTLLLSLGGAAAVLVVAAVSAWIVGRRGRNGTPLS